MESSLNFLFPYFKPVIILFQKKPLFCYFPKKLYFYLRLLTVLSLKFIFSRQSFLSLKEKGWELPHQSVSYLKLPALLHEDISHSYPRLSHLLLSIPLASGYLFNYYHFFLFFNLYSPYPDSLHHCDYYYSFGHQWSGWECLSMWLS